MSSNRALSCFKWAPWNKKKNNFFFGSGKLRENNSSSLEGRSKKFVIDIQKQKKNKNSSLSRRRNNKKNILMTPVWSLMKWEISYICILNAYLWKCSLIRSSRVLSGKFATQRWRVSRTILPQLIHGGGLRLIGHNYTQLTITYFARLLSRFYNTLSATRSNSELDCVFFCNDATVP